MTVIVASEDDYESLLGQWADLESGLAMVLHHPQLMQEFVPRVTQYDRWMQDLLRLDTDIGLYLLFQLAISSPAGYSTSHALVCAVLCQMLADELALPAHERNSLVRAALTMNVAMTGMQDQLSKQQTRPKPEQQIAINTHASEGALLLNRLGVADALWLEIVQLHHHKSGPDDNPSSWSPGLRLAHILSVVDRYAALISPRQTREGRSAIESAKHILQEDVALPKPVGQTLVRLIGLYPPGTFVQLDNHDIAVVLNRSAMPDLPNVAIILNAHGETLKPARLHRTSMGNPVVKTALVATAIQVRINHHRILQLGNANASAAAQP